MRALRRGRIERATDEVDVPEAAGLLRETGCELWLEDRVEVAVGDPGRLALRAGQPCVT